MSTTSWPLDAFPEPRCGDADDRRIYADSLRAPNGIAGSVGWYPRAFETARQNARHRRGPGFAVPVMAFGGEFGVPVTLAQFDAIPGEEAGGHHPGAGHLLPEEVPEILAREMDPFFDAAEAR